MNHIVKVGVTPGIDWIAIPEADLRVLCGCPADSVKHLMRRGLILPTEIAGVASETGPNAILLSDVMVQNGTFCNMAEFPVLQMLYRQGMMLPNHPNNKGRKPLLIGRRDAVESQMQYIYRGNYGLISEEEMRAAGATAEQARALMRLKLRFAFGRIQHPSELLDSATLGEQGDAIELRPGVTLRRTGHNQFEFAYRGETAQVDLNLPPFEGYECPYQLGAYKFERGYFSIVHCGEGDGWDFRRPTMGAIVVYQGRIFLVDAGPNLLAGLTALGIGINEIEGIFHTHCHDDHFAGLTTLIQGDRRLKHFATPLVRAGIMKKLSALLGIEDRDFHEYFEVVDLKPEEWNDIDGLEVRPVFSPHPVETTVFFFRTLMAGGWRTYAHLADIVALETLDGMITDDPDAPGIDRAMFESVRDSYLEPTHVKKIDIGGGMIHGQASDFEHDQSTKIILAHVARNLSNDEKQIGSGQSFGTVDVLAPTHRDFTARSAFYHLIEYFPRLARDHLAALLNAPIRSFDPETILLKEGHDHDSIYLLLTGQVEMLHAESAFRSTLTSGALLGEMAGLHGLAALETCRAISSVQALEIPCDLYVRFVQRHELFADITKLMKGREFLRRTWLCSGIMSTGALNAIANEMTVRELAAGASWDTRARAVGIVKTGRLRRMLADEELELLGPGDSFGEEEAVFGAPAFTSLVATEPTEILAIPVALMRGIPNVLWKLFECFERRTRLEAASAYTTRRLLRWHDDYAINVQSVDKQHRRLLDIANKLLTEVEAKHSQEAIAETFERLLGYALHHFTEEESLLHRYGYPEAVEHAAKHKKLLAQVEEFATELRGGGIAADALVELFHKWVLNHMLIEDRKFGPFLNERGVY